MLRCWGDATTMILAFDAGRTPSALEPLSFCRYNAVVNTFKCPPKSLVPRANSCAWECGSVMWNSAASVAACSQDGWLDSCPGRLVEVCHLLGLGARQLSGAIAFASCPERNHTDGRPMHGRYTTVSSLSSIQHSSATGPHPTPEMSVPKASASYPQQTVMFSPRP